MDKLFKPYSLDSLNLANRIETIGDAREIRDIYTAVHAGYRLAQSY